MSRWMVDWKYSLEAIPVTADCGQDEARAREVFEIAARQMQRRGGVQVRLLEDGAVVDHWAPSEAPAEEVLS